MAAQRLLQQLRLLRRPHPAWPLARLAKLVYSGKGLLSGKPLPRSDWAGTAAELEAIPGITAAEARGCFLVRDRVRTACVAMTRCVDAMSTGVLALETLVAVRPPRVVAGPRVAVVVVGPSRACVAPF